MDFEFSAEQQALRNQARRFFSARCTTSLVRNVMDGNSPYDRELWAYMAEMGFLGITVPEQYGGLGLSYLELCVVAEEVGRAVAPVPFSSSIYLATEFLLRAGNEAQKQHWLPRLSSGKAIGTFAFVEAAGAVFPHAIATGVESGQLNGVKCIVPDGAIADVAVVAARDDAGISLYLVELGASGVERTSVETIDPGRNHASIVFTNVTAEPLGERGEGWLVIQRVLDTAAILVAFEQVGGAEAALTMGRNYALERMAFGREIGSFQAIKHMLADMYVSLALARANAYYGAWALSNSAEELPQAAATARISATRAFQHCAKNNIQIHGGIGFTWEVDCHLYYRRSNLLALSLGSMSEWEKKLIERLDMAAARSAT